MTMIQPETKTAIKELYALAGLLTDLVIETAVSGIKSSVKNFSSVRKSREERLSLNLKAGDVIYLERRRMNYFSKVPVITNGLNLKELLSDGLNLLDYLDYYSVDSDSEEPEKQDIPAYTKETLVIKKFIKPKSVGIFVKLLTLNDIELKRTTAIKGSYIRISEEELAYETLYDVTTMKVYNPFALCLLQDGVYAIRLSNIWKK